MRNRIYSEVTRRNFQQGFKTTFHIDHKRRTGRSPTLFVAAHKRNLGQGNIFALVCHSVHRGSTWAGTLPAGTHPWVGTPPGRYTPQLCMLGYGQQAGGMHPTGMHSCSGSFF